MAHCLKSDLFKKMEDFSPLKYSTGQNIGRNWCMWRQNFLNFLQKEDPIEHYEAQRTIILLMLIGPLGERAYNDLNCRKDPTKDFESVLRDLDLYFIFGLRRMRREENIEKYIDTLMLIAIGSNHSDPVSIVKEKIIQDLKNYNFTGKAMLFVQSKGINLVSYLQSLNLHQITSFWKQCEELMSQKNCENARNQIPLQSTDRMCSLQRSPQQEPLSSLWKSMRQMQGVQPLQGELQSEIRIGLHQVWNKSHSVALPRLWRIMHRLWQIQPFLMVVSGAYH